MMTRNHARMLLVLAGSCCLPASAAFAATVTVSDIETQAPGLTINVPSIELTDANLTEAQVRDLFKGDIAGNAEALAGLEAASISIPELTVTFDVKSDEEGEPDSKGELHYQDIALNDINGGVAASVSFGGIDMTGDAKSKGHFGAMSMEHFDIGGILGFYGLVPSNAGSDMKVLYSNFRFDGGQIGDDDFSCTVGAARMDELKARPLKHSLLDFMAVAEGLDSDETPDPATMGTFVAFYADLLTAFQTTPMTFDGLDCSGETDEDGPISVRLGGLEIGGFTPGLYPAFTANDIAITAEDGAVSLASFVFKQMDLTGVLDVLASAPAAIADSWFEAHARQLIPAFAGLSFSGLDGDVPDEENEGQRIKFKIGDFDLTLADYVNGVPSNISNDANGIVMDVPQTDDPDNPLKDLADFGIKTINASYGLKAHWDQDAQTIEVENFSLHGDDLGTFALSGTLGNASPDLFSTDVEAAQLAAMGLTVKSVTTNVEDLGLGAIVLAKAGAEQGRSADEMRGMVSGIAQGSALALLGANEGSQQLSNALNAFLMGSNPAITVVLTAIDPAGLGLGDLMALQEDPTQLSSKVKIEASNQ